MRRAGLPLASNKTSIWNGILSMRVKSGGPIISSRDSDANRDYPGSHTSDQVLHARVNLIQK